MDNQMKIIDLLNEKNKKVLELDRLIYGAPEIRENDNKSYLYVHYKEDGVSRTKYVGEYSDELNSLLLNNNIKAKELKKEIKKINKELSELNYVDEELTESVCVNIDFAKRHLVDTIYKQAILEGVATTLSDTESIIEGGRVNNMSTEDVMKIVNLKHAWDFILNKNLMLTKSDYYILCNINKIVEEGFYYTAGNLRTTPVKIGGTSWAPDLPIETNIKEDLLTILGSNNTVCDIAIKLVLYITKSQMFIDGNKRTAIIFANHYLISHGKGMIVIPAELTEQYKNLLIKYYESNDEVEIFNFLKEKCYLDI